MAPMHPMDPQRIALLEEENELLRAALADAANGLRNDFEPDNQSAVYKRTIAALNHKATPKAEQSALEK